MRVEALIQFPPRSRGGGSAARATRSSVHEARGEPSGLKGTPALRRSRPWRFSTWETRAVFHAGSAATRCMAGGRPQASCAGLTTRFVQDATALPYLRDRSGDAPRTSKVIILYNDFFS